MPENFRSFSGTATGNPLRHGRPPRRREGFHNIFLRRRFPVYLIDQPRRGRAARSTQPVDITATPDEQLWFGIFRLGAWPNFAVYRAIY